MHPGCGLGKKAVTTKNTNKKALKESQQEDGIKSKRFLFSSEWITADKEEEHIRVQVNLLENILVIMILKLRFVIYLMPCVILLRFKQCCTWIVEHNFATDTSFFNFWLIGNGSHSRFWCVFLWLLRIILIVSCECSMLAVQRRRCSHFHIFHINFLLNTPKRVLSNSFPTTKFGAECKYVCLTLVSFLGFEIEHK